MNNIKVLIAAVLCACSTLVLNAQENDDYTKFQSQIDNLSSDVEILKARERKNSNDLSNLSKIINEQKGTIDSLLLISATNEKRIDDTAKTLENDINNTQASLSDILSHLNADINSKSLYAGIVGVIALIFAIIIYIFYKRETGIHHETMSKFDDSIKGIKEEQKTLEQGMTNINTKLLDTIEKQLVVLSNKEETSDISEPDHSLAIAVANEIARIQQNLNHMDDNVRGVSQLKNRAKAIITTLKSKQYDIPDLLGRSYHEGDNMVVTMELNEELEEGSNRIKRVIKPQVSYEGRLIQPAEVVVEYNE